MTKNKEGKKGTFKAIRRAFPYLLFCLAVCALAFFGSKSKFEKTETSLDMRALAQNNFSASADQVAELYVVSEVATSMKTATAAVIATNYDSVISASSLVSNASTAQLEKPNVVDTSNLAVGVLIYEVQPGESIASIAARYSGSGVTETMIRWSNNFKAGTQVNPGDKIYVPGRAGFVHVVRKNENIHTLAANYGSTVEDLIAANSLELTGDVTEGMLILVPNGNLPENERPDYVAPVATNRSTNSYWYTAQYSAGNKYAFGWCTWYAWSMRTDLPSNMGNASNWAAAARGAGFPVDGSPRAGDIFQTGAGGWGYGHVGYVNGVNADGSISVCDMNGIAGWGRVGCATWDAGHWRGYQFIHRR